MLFDEIVLISWNYAIMMSPENPFRACAVVHHLGVRYIALEDGRLCCVWVANGLDSRRIHLGDDGACLGSPGSRHFDNLYTREFPK